MKQLRNKMTNAEVQADLQRIRDLVRRESLLYKNLRGEEDNPPENDESYIATVLTNVVIEQMHRNSNTLPDFMRRASVFLGIAQEHFTYYICKWRTDGKHEG